MKLTKEQKRLIKLTESVLFEHPNRDYIPEHKITDDEIESIRTYLRKLQRQENSIRVY